LSKAEKEEANHDRSGEPTRAYPTRAYYLSPDEGETVRFGGLGVRFMIDVAATGGTFALVEHPTEPRVLAAPMHTHRHEDEYTYVLEGEIGVQVGEEVRVARPGDLVFKPRGVPHAFWNAGDASAWALEIISPAGFEQYFAEIAPLLPPTRPGPATSGRSVPSWSNTGSRWTWPPSPCSCSATD
jgi:mannose-6-phosphate isomerase-like protein (cupin superfamily)